MSCTGVLAVAHFLMKSSFIRFRRHAWKPKGYIFKNILLIGLSPFSMNLAASAVVALLNNQLIRYGGDLAVGAYGLVNTFASLSVMLMVGLCQGMQPIAGYNYGAGHPHRLREVYTLTMKLNMLVGLVGTLLAMFLPHAMLRMFTKEEELIQIGIPAMRFIMVMFPLVGFTITNSNFFQSIDKPWIAIVTSLSRQVLFLAPMIYIIPPLFVNAGVDGLTGVWASITISDVLDMTVNQAVEFFESQPYILKKIKTIQDVGLGYIKLGQSSTTLSGGESQRIKLAAELSRPSTGDTLYILDEPTTGLHFEDIHILLNVLRRLVDKGNTVIIIEHNLDVIRACDHLIDLGTEGGRDGGNIVAQGTIEDLKNNPASITGKYL